MTRFAVPPGITLRDIHLRESTSSILARARAARDNPEATTEDEKRLPLTDLWNIIELHGIRTEQVPFLMEVRSSHE